MKLYSMHGLDLSFLKKEKEAKAAPKKKRGRPKKAS
jgi:hypothetical protein